MALVDVYKAAASTEVHAFEVTGSFATLVYKAAAGCAGAEEYLEDRRVTGSAVDLEGHCIDWHYCCCSGYCCCYCGYCGYCCCSNVNGHSCEPA